MRYEIEPEWAPRQVGLWEAPVPQSVALAQPTAGDEFHVDAVANHGRWVVECPGVGCGGAQMLHPLDTRFLCVICANVDVEGLWRPVVWPADLVAIEFELDRRDDPETRNTLVGETVADLRRERETVEEETAASTDAPEWEGHTHAWPRRRGADPFVTCSVCGLVLPASDVFEGATS